jgi:hypothetical protein
VIALVLATCMSLGQPSDWTTDEAGRSFRVGFDPGTRFLFGAGWRWRDESRLLLETGWLIRADDHDDGVTWKLAHTIGFLTTEVGAGLAGVLYRGEYLRWASDGAIVIPTAPPARIPFPLDIGFSLELGRARTHPGDDAFALDLGLVGAEILFDAWRSPRSGSSLVLGVGPSWDLWIEEGGAAWHAVAPFSSARLTLHHEWQQARQLFEATLRAATRWTSHGGWADRAGAEVAWEWIVFALNDAPVALRIAAGWEWDEILAAEGHVLSLDAGLRLGL